MSSPAPAASRPAHRSWFTRPAVWVLVSVMLHGLVWLRGNGKKDDMDDVRAFKLPAQLDFGVVEQNKPGGGNRSANEPPPKPLKIKPTPKHHAKPPPDPSAYGMKVKSAATKEKRKKRKEKEVAARSGNGDDPDSLGKGLGDGIGDGTGYAPIGATIALNVDLARVRKTALVLETKALLDIIPEWQGLLTDSGVDPLQDLERVFVASPTLERANVVVSASHQLPRARLSAAVSQLASAAGKHASFHLRDGFEVAPWVERGATERVIALTGQDQFTITRSTDLERVLNVAASLAHTREQQGFKASELEKHGGLLAMQDKEAVALWVEGVGKYVRGEAQGVPQAMRMSLYVVDQFNTDLQLRGQYASEEAATAAIGAMDTLRQQLSNHEKVLFLGLKSAVDKAEIEQKGAALVLHVKLTLHQTRYLMRFVTRTLRPRSSASSESREASGPTSGHASGQK